MLLRELVSIMDGINDELFAEINRYFVSVVTEGRRRKTIVKKEKVKTPI